MSLSSTTSRVSYTGNGSVDTYSYTFKVFDEDDLLVTVRDTSDVQTTLVKTTDYTVTGVGATAGGTIVLVNSAQAWLDVDGDLKTGYVLVIRRKLQIKQETDIRNADSYYPEVIEDQFDSLVMIDQQQQDEIDRSVKLPESVSSASFDPTLPSDILDSADRVPMMNATGDGFAAVADWPTATAIAGANADALAAAASAAAALVSETNAATSEATAEEWATKTDDLVGATDNSAKAYAIGGTGGGQPAGGDAKSWAQKTSAAVTAGLYSAKEWALGVLTRGLSGGGSAKDWANYTGGTVDDTEYSAKKYAQDAAAALASAFFRDVVYKTSADSPVSITSADNGKIFVFDTSGGAIAVSLPQISTLTPPFNIGFLLKTAGNNLTVSRAGTDTIMGATSKVVSTAGVGFQLAADTDGTPDDWTALDFGSVTDGAISKLKLDGTTTSQMAEVSNHGIAASVAANALTVALKTKAGSDASATAPISIGMRNSTASTGTYNLRQVTGALSVVVPSGATLGHPSGSAAYVYVYAIDNAGTVELAVSSVLYDERGLQSTSAIGTGSDDSGLYSTTARSNVAIRLLGRITSTQATAGTWATSPSEISLASLNAYGESRVNTEAVSTTQYDQASPSVGTWYAPANAVTVSVPPGTYEITVQGTAYLLHSSANTGAVLMGSLATSTTPGSGLLDKTVFLLDNYYPTGAVANIHRAEFFQFTTKDLTFTTATNLYFHIKYANSSGTPTVNNIGFQILATGNEVSLRIIAKRVG